MGKSGWLFVGLFTGLLVGAIWASSFSIIGAVRGVIGYVVAIIVTVSDWMFFFGILWFVAVVIPMAAVTLSVMLGQNLLRRWRGRGAEPGRGKGA